MRERQAGREKKWTENHYEWARWKALEKFQFLENRKKSHLLSNRNLLETEPGAWT